MFHKANHLTFKYILTTHLSKINRGCAFVGTKHQETTTKTTTQQPQLQVFASMFANHHICLVLQSSVYYIGGGIVQIHA